MRIVVYPESHFFKCCVVPSEKCDSATLVTILLATVCCCRYAVRVGSLQSLEVWYMPPAHARAKAARVWKRIIVQITDIRELLNCAHGCTDCSCHAGCRKSGYSFEALGDMFPEIDGRSIQCQHVVCGMQRATLHRTRGNLVARNSCIQKDFALNWVIVLELCAPV